MQTHQIHVVDGYVRVHEIRNELFAFPEILDVFATGRADAIVIVYFGRPRPGEWLRALRAVGYDAAARRRPPRSHKPPTEPRRPSQLTPRRARLELSRRCREPARDVAE